ncbi:hypothetical protein TUBRATIS_25690 [Tubulinosema ratisbonensis]|uniref:Uncharacterized protein n=1 Tax=Tubulinosema ratisbonensis TaxID=291195 RepID=A0A437AIM6_9MICR|nr:hypothetical protein TUBRATIS_25690 [Tubulinosema ratisbonensis]
MPSKMYAIVIIHCALFICGETSNTSCHLNYKDTVNKESISMETEKFDAKNENDEINNFSYRDYDSRIRVLNLCYRIVPTSEDTSKNILSKPIPTFPGLNNTEIDYSYESNEPIDLSTKNRNQTVSSLQNNLLCKNKGAEKQLYDKPNISLSNKDNNTLKSLETTKGPCQSTLNRVFQKSRPKIV